MPTQQMIRGIHVNWTAPHFLGRRRDGFVASATPSRFDMPDFEIMTTVLSILSWQRFHGPMVLYTDRAGLRFARTERLADLYEEIDTATLTSADARRLSPAVYWAGGKLLAYRDCPLPFACVDTDLFLYRKIDAIDRYDVMFAHWETLSPYIYPDRTQLPNRRKVRFPRWDWQMKACNCAVAMLKDARHRESYTDAAIRYMFDNEEMSTGAFPSAQQVFVEQRIIGFEAKRLGVRHGAVLPQLWDARLRRWVGSEPKTPQLHHTWRSKSRLIEDASLNDMYCTALAGVMVREYPDAIRRVERIARVAHWLRRYRRETAAIPRTTPN